MSEKSLPYIIQKRCCSAWCWAAVLSSIMEVSQISGEPTSQPGIVQQVMGLNMDLSSCCPNGCPNLEPTCNLPAQMGPALSSLNLSYSGSQNLADVGYAGIRAEIDANRPVIAQIAYDVPPGGFHFLLINGYCDPDTLAIGDPASGELSSVSFSIYSQPEAYADVYPGLHGTWKLVFFVDNA